MYATVECYLKMGIAYMLAAARNHCTKQQVLKMRCNISLNQYQSPEVHAAAGQVATLEKSGTVQSSDTFSQLPRRPSSTISTQQDLSGQVNAVVFRSAGGGMYCTSWHLGISALRRPRAQGLPYTTAPAAAWTWRHSVLGSTVDMQPKDTVLCCSYVQ